MKQNRCYEISEGHCQKKVCSFFLVLLKPTLQTLLLGVLPLRTQLNAMLWKSQIRKGPCVGALDISLGLWVTTAQALDLMWRIVQVIPVLSYLSHLLHRLRRRDRPSPVFPAQIPDSEFMNIIKILCVMPLFRLCFTVIDKQNRLKI